MPVNWHARQNFCRVGLPWGDTCLITHTTCRLVSSQDSKAVGGAGEGECMGTPLPGRQLSIIKRKQ